VIFRSRNQALALFKQKSSHKLSSFRIQEPIKKTWLVIYLDITRHKWNNFARTHILKLVFAVVTLTNRNGSSVSKKFAESPKTLRQSPRGSIFFSASDATLELGVIFTAYPKFVNFTVRSKISLWFNSNPRNCKKWNTVINSNLYFCNKPNPRELWCLLNLDTSCKTHLK